MSNQFKPNKVAIAVGIIAIAAIATMQPDGKHALPKIKAGQQMSVDPTRFELAPQSQTMIITNPPATSDLDKMIGDRQ